MSVYYPYQSKITSGKYTLNQIGLQIYKSDYIYDTNYY